MQTALDGQAARAYLAPWPNDPAVLRVVLVDHHMVPTSDDVARWVAAARRTGARALRSGALFPAASEVFATTGFAEIDRLVLLRREARPGDGTSAGRGRARDLSRPARPSLRRLRPWHLDRAANLDLRAFGLLWGNDTASLEATRRATPTHRARVAFDRSTMVGLAIWGRAGSTGYLQRLAVDPAAQRRGIGRHLVLDGLRWMGHGRVSSVYVNTSTTNDPAIALYESMGFVRQQQALTILERDLCHPDRGPGIGGRE